MLRAKSYMLLIVLMISLSGCMGISARDMVHGFNLNAPYQAQDDLERSAASWHAEISAHQKWWRLYGDEELNILVQLALSNNPNLNQIRARLKQAQALTRQSRAARLPTLDATGNSTTSRGDNRVPSVSTLGAAAGFEIDLWGKNRADYQSNALEAQASREDMHAAMISLSGSIVENWLDILSLMEQESLVRKQIDVNRSVLDLQVKRFEMGSSSALDLLQQEETLARAEAQLPDILSAQKLAANALALLIGETPYTGLKITEKPMPDALPIPRAGLPSDLLEDRPDIVAAWARLRGADWASKAAWADRLPRFDLSAAYSTSAGTIGNLFNNWLLDLAASVAAPVFDGGRRKAEQFRQEAIADERYHAYREVVLSAVVEVEDALVRNTYQDQKMVALARQLAASRNTLHQAQFSYANGQSDYINVLNSLNNTQLLEQQIAVEQLLQAKERVRLYRALGGRSWMMDDRG